MCASQASAAPIDAQVGAQCGGETAQRSPIAIRRFYPIANTLRAVVGSNHLLSFKKINDGRKTTSSFPRKREPSGVSNSRNDTGSPLSRGRRPFCHSLIETLVGRSAGIPHRSVSNTSRAPIAQTGPFLSAGAGTRGSIAATPTTPRRPSRPLEHRRNSLPTADAHRLQPIPSLTPLQLM